MKHQNVTFNKPQLFGAQNIYSIGILFDSKIKSLHYWSVGKSSPWLQSDLVHKAPAQLTLVGLIIEANVNKFCYWPVRVYKCGAGQTVGHNLESFIQRLQPRLLPPQQRLLARMRAQALSSRRRVSP